MFRRWRTDVGPCQYRRFGMHLRIVKLVLFILKQLRSDKNREECNDVDLAQEAGEEK